MEEKNVNEVFEFEGTTLQVVETEEMNCKNCYNINARKPINLQLMG